MIEINKLKYTEQQLEEDIRFLARRASIAGSFSTDDSDRETGSSSNSIVSISYGEWNLNSQCMPSDWSDLQSCKRMWAKLPEHRKTHMAWIAMARAVMDFEQRHPST